MIISPNKAFLSPTLVRNSLRLRGIWQTTKRLKLASHSQEILMPISAYLRARR